MGGLSEDCRRGHALGRLALEPPARHPGQDQCCRCGGSKESGSQGPGGTLHESGTKVPLYRRVGIRRQVLLQLGHSHGAGNLPQHHARPRRHRAPGPLSCAPCALPGPPSSGFNDKRPH